MSPVRRPATARRAGRAGLLSLLLVIFSLVLAGCGGGGSGGGGATTPTPTASVGAPSVTGLTPGSGPIAGNVSIEISGSALAGASVTVGGRAASGVSVNSDGTRVTAVVPGGAAEGAADVVVTTPGGTASSPRKFLYNGTPAISFVSPTSGPLNGGTNVTLLGSYFDGTVTVTVGGQPATSVAISSDKTQLTFVTPAGSAVGANDIEVAASAAGTVRMAGGFTYTGAIGSDPPAISSVTPLRGPMTGGTTLVLLGARFGGSIVVTVGGRAASNVSVNAAQTQITCTSPASPISGAVDVVVLSDRAGSATAAGAFTYNPSPVIGSISPSVGPQGGNTAFALNGSNFDGAVTVQIGGRGATNLVVNAAKTQITGRTPASTSTGPKDVVVTSDSNGVATLAGGFTYNGPPPTLSRIAPTAGPNRGGTLVTIDGANFRGLMSVTFGGAAATAVTVNTARTQLTCRTPAFAGTGAVDVVVTSDTHGSVTAAGAFTYNANPQPVLSSITPSSGPLAGGTQVTIAGSNFFGTLTLTFGGVAATGVTVNGAGTQITATVPRGAVAGFVDVFLDSTTHGSVTLADGYVYNDPVQITGVFPTSGPKAGGTQVIISGANFFGNLTVEIGAAQASITAIDANQLTVITNASPTTGTRNVTVTSTTNGVAVRANAFTYTANPQPVITSLTPNNGPLSGGTVVTVTGANFEGTVNVTVGGVGAGAVSVSGDRTQLTFATPPAATAGARDVVIGSSSHGTVTLGGGFTYNAAPTITTITPASGPATGGTLVNIAGTGFGGVVSVRFGFFTATDVLVVSSTLVQARTPAGTAGTNVDVTLNSSTNGIATKAGGFLYNPPATLGAINPTSGPLTGGNTVVLTGTNLGGTVNVTFGNANATVVSSNGTSTVTVLAPAGATPGTVAVGVFSSTNGPAQLGAAYTYNPLPTIALPLSPTSGAIAGGTLLTINGTNFGGTVNVTVGGQPAVVQSVNGAGTQIVARTPPGAAAVAVDVVVSSSTNGLVSAAGAFTYNPPPEIFAVTPASGPQVGGASVTIDGNNFFGTVNVTIGAVPATVVSVNPFKTQVTVLTTASPDFGVKDVTVSSSSHGSVTKVGAYTYIPPLPTITNVQPASGALDGDTLVTLTGTSFEGTVNVSFGNIPATQVTVNPARTSLTLRTPPGAAAVPVDVTLSSSTHGSVTRVNGYAYNPRMTITSINPPQGPVGGFNTVNIDGTNFFGNIEVSIGGNPLIGTSVNAAKTRITGTVPSGTSPGTVPLVVTSDTHGTVTSNYVYNNSPSINALNPAAGPLAGGTVVDITGGGFFGTVIVKIGATFASAPAATVQSVSGDGTTIRILTPPGTSAGPTNVFVSSSTNGQTSRTNGFTYNSPPQATGVVPNNGPLSGGTPVIINGGGFFGTVTVTFGGLLANVLSVDTAGNTISALSPAGGAAGPVDVVINASAGGATTITSGFTYNPLPTVTSGVTPTEGPAQGGTPLQIVGTGFGGTVNVTVCGVPATNVTVNLARTLIDCRTGPTDTPGLGNVIISSSTNGSVTVANAFTYNATPTIASIIPDNGPQSGFTPVTINGTGFRGTVTGTIGGAALTSVVVVSPTQITANTPPSIIIGPRDVAVTSSLNGTVNVSGAYTYNPSTVITQVEPNQGPQAGGTPVVITGSNFGGTVNVTFGSVTAPVTFQTLTQINVLSPPGLATGPVDVRVQSTTSGLATLPGAFTYNAPMTIGTLNPATGPLAGDQLVSMSGTNFVDVTAVLIDGVAATGLTVNSASNITFRTPSSNFPGPVEVEVQSSTRGVATKPDGYTYNPEPFILNVTPSEGPLFGGTNVTITGTNFATPLSVRFGSATAQTLSISPTAIIVRSPPSATAGDVAVTVDSVPNGPFTVFPGFTYNNTPSFGTINPDNGPLVGNNLVIITGTDFDPATQVLIDGRNVTVTSISIDRTTINGLAPPGVSPGPKAVVINAPASGSVTLTSGYTYNPPISVSAIAPTSGPITGGTLVTLTGENLLGPPTVKIGTLDALGVTVGNSGTQLQFTTPTSSVTGTFDVIVSSPAFGTLNVTNAFTYNGILDAVSLTPDTGTVNGGTTVNVTGTGFFNLTAVELGGIPVRSFTTNVSGTLIVAVTEAASPGLKDLRVASSTHGEDTLVGAYTYVPNYVAGAQQPTFANPVGLAVKDVNGDGKPDAIITNQLDDAVTFYFNNSVPGGTPSFAPTQSVTFTTGDEPTGLVVADLDNDGLQDVVTANKLSNDLTVLLSITAPGSAAPTFTAMSPIANTGGPSAVVAEDFNGDGRVDVAVTSELGGFLRVRINTTVLPGFIQLGGASPTFGTGLAPVAICAADLNGDGKPDLATANKDSNSVSIIQNNCVPGSITPSFSNVSTLILPAGSSPQGVAAADLNGDGRMDLVVANSVGRNVTVFINTTTDSASAPAFGPGAAFLGAGAPAGIAVGDIDLNGRPDVATANDSGNSISFRLNNTAPGATTGALSGRTDFPSGVGPRAMVLADLNGDGRPEMVTVSRLSNQLQVFQHNSQLGISPAAFTGRTDFGAGTGPNAIVAADMNRDGKLDLLVSNEASNDFSVKINQTVPGSDVIDFLTLSNFLTGTAPSGPDGIAAVDLDGDGRLDVVVSNRSNSNIRAHLNATPVGTNSVAFGSGFNFGFPLNNPAGVAVGDLSLDGRPDVVVAQRGISRVMVLRNTTTLGGGPPAFSPTLNVTSGAGPRGMAIGDLNGDGKNDLVSANGSSSTVTITLNATAPAGGINLPTGVDFATDLNPAGVALLDFNGDGKLDLVTCNQGASNVTFLRNTTPPGSMTPVFNGRIEWPTGVGPAGIQVRDVNGDGRPDVITSALDADQVSVLLNGTPQGGGQAFFPVLTNIPVGDGPEGVAVGDFNGDGRPDAATAAKLGSVLSVIRNITTP